MPHVAGVCYPILLGWLCIHDDGLHWRQLSSHLHKMLL